MVDGTGLFGRRYNWAFRSPGETVVGTISRVFLNTSLKEDGDIHIDIVPDLDYDHVLTNRNGRRGANVKIACEIKPGKLLYDSYAQWAQTLLGAKATVRGVYVDDVFYSTEYPELHPLDLLVGHLDESRVQNSSWISEIAFRRRLRVGTSLLAYRYAAASDTRHGWFHYGPPRWDVTRTVRQALPLPPRPGQNWTPVLDHRNSFLTHAEARAEVLGGGPPGGRAYFDLTVRCDSDDDKGPGIALGEVVAYWKNPAAPEIALEPESLHFGSLNPGAQSTNRVRIRNVGGGPLQLNIPGSSGLGSVFGWSALDGLSIAPGSYYDANIEFRPLTEGDAGGTWRVVLADDSIIGPRMVRLTGHRKPGRTP